MKTYRLEDGKYEIDRDDRGLIVAMRRNGEPWPEGMGSLQFVKVFHAALNEIDGLQDDPDFQSRAMFVARLQHLPAGKTMSPQDVLALLSDCDMLASQNAAGAPSMCATQARGYYCEECGPPPEALHGFQREDLEAVAEGLEAQPATVNVGQATGDDGADTLLESTAAYAARFIRAVLAAASPTTQPKKDRQ